MIGRLSKTICLVLVTALMVIGCRQQYKQSEDVLACAPEPQALTIPADYVSKAIVATGGLQEWAKATKLDLDGVVTLYQPDGSVYLTEQHYEVYPWSNFVRVSALEPQGKFICELSQGSFKVLAGAEIVETLPTQVSERDLAEAMLTITTASIRLLDHSVNFTRASEPVKIQGLWYYPIERTYAVQEQTAGGGKLKDAGVPQSYSSKVIFYQNKDNLRVDILWFADAKGKKFSLVRGYDYSRLQINGLLLPARIEVFKTDARGALPQRLAQVSFK